MSQVSCSNAVQKALASSSTFVQGSLLQPSIKYVPEEETRGFTPQAPEQWVLQADVFQNKLIDQYQQIRLGETRMLIAATGIGKTTVLPLRLAMSSGKSGIVLLPDGDLLPSVVKYVSEVVVVNGGFNVKVDVLRSKHIIQPFAGAAVYYSSANDFLPRFHADRNLISRMNIDYIYLDEAHSQGYAYYIMRMLVGLDFFSDTKVFCGTATHWNTSVILTSKPSQTSPLSVSSNMFTLDTPEEVPNASPLSAMAINCRTMIFLATDHQIYSWRLYYDSYDILTFTFFSFDSTKVLASIAAGLKRKRPCVLLTNHRLQTGHTFDIDKVICCGYTQYMHVDYSAPSVELRVRTVTAVERKQRMGRADRHLTGSSFYNDVQLSPPTPELDSVSSIYVWMWARMFNINVKNPDVAQFEELMGGCSLSFISLMLCSRLHPVLVMPYMTLEGSVYAGWDIMKHVFHTTKPVPIASESNEDSVALWPDRNTGPQVWTDSPIDYKSRTSFPHEWQALPAVAWMTYADKYDLSLDLDNRSVVSALAPIEKRVLKSALKSTKTVSSLKRPTSVMTTKKNQSPIDVSLPALPRIPEVYATEQVPSSLPTIKSVEDRIISDDTIDIPRNDVAQWVTNVGASGRARRSSRHSSSSDSSHDRPEIKLKKVDAYTFRMYKLYPMDLSLLAVFVNSESATREDVARFKDLLRLNKNFATLSVDAGTRGEKQSEWFLSVLKLHNAYVMQSLQEKAAGSQKQSFMDKLLYGKSSASVETQIIQSAKMLDGMKLEGFFVGIDTRVLHTSSRVSVDGALLEKQRHPAEFLLLISDPNLALMVQDMHSSVQPITSGGVIRGVGWLFRSVFVTLNHVVSDIEMPETFTLVHVDVDNDIVVYVTPHMFAEHPRLRGPVDGETVIMVGFNPSSGEPIVQGPCEVMSSCGVWTIDKVLCAGCSGFALLAVEDMSLVGLYKGFYITLSNGKNYGHFVSTDDFFAPIARNFSG